MIAVCDCGAPCKDARQGCDRCRFLDGNKTGDAMVIAALRLVGKAAPCEIAAIAGMNPTSVGRILKRLRAQGRVEYLGHEVHVFESNRSKGKIDQFARHYFELRSA